MSFWLFVPLVIGINLTLWTLVGALRLVDERIGRPRRTPAQPDRDYLALAGVERDEVAVLMAAHNESAVISPSLARLASLVPPTQVYVVSDYSTDDTVALAEAAGVNVVATPTNVGKAGALSYGLLHFRLVERYAAVTIVDADTRLDPAYFDTALPWLDDPRVSAVAGCAHTLWQRPLGRVGSVVVAYRERTYVLMQYLLKYGQTWRGISATYIVPGFASIYRTSALRRIRIDTPGLVIEDFNMTFQLQAQRLGRIAFDPGVRAYTQDPARYGEYVRQVRRWSLGLWQTVRGTRARRPAFALTLWLTLVELVTSSLALVLLPLAVLLAVVGSLAPEAASLPVGGPVVDAAETWIRPESVALGVLLPDYLLTCVVAIAQRRWAFLVVGLFFMPMRYTDAVLALYTLPRAWLDRSTGQWVSPTRRAVPVEEVAEARLGT
jgi:poly-beta-1,6-N-acetyl-D-glucosamine synthase